MASRKAFLLRMNEALYKELETWAQEEFRSVNGQIEFLLRQQVLRRKRQQDTPGAESTDEADGETGE